MALMSPNELLARAREAELDGRLPINSQEAGLLMFCIARLIAPGVEVSCCRLMRSLYPDELGAFLSERDTVRIAEHVAAHRG